MRAAHGAAPTGVNEAVIDCADKGNEGPARVAYAACMTLNPACRASLAVGACVVLFAGCGGGGALPTTGAPQSPDLSTAPDASNRQLP